jgi:hypothetical protein
MAMFDLKDSEDIKISDCHTDSSTLVIGEGLKRIEAHSSSAITGPAPVSRKPRILGFLINHTAASLVSLGIGLLIAYLTYRFGWTSN